MNLDEGATHEINSRWPEYKQRNAALMPDVYGRGFTENLTIGIQLVRDHHAELESRGETIWSIPEELTKMLDDLKDGKI